MIWKSLCVLILFSGGILLAGCQPGQSSPTAATRTPATASVPDTGNQPTALPGIDTTLTPPEEALVSLAKQRLAEKFQLDPQEFRLFSILPMSWPDSSLGCPQPGVLYQPVVTPGYQMVFEGGGQTYVVHSDQSDYVVICAFQAPTEIYLPP